MRKYKFYSRLKSDEILSRLEQYAKPAKFGYQLTSQAFFYRIYDNKRFWLLKTPPLCARGQVPFCAEILVEANGAATTIIGSFTQPPEVKKVLILFTLIAPICMLLMGGPTFLLPALLFWLLASALVYVIFYVLAPVLWKRERAAVIAFIEKYLL